MRLTEEFRRFQQRMQAERQLGLGIPVVLFFAGLVNWLFRSNAGFMAGLMAGTTVGVVALYLILFRQCTVRLSWIMATGLLLGYIGGALNTDVGLMRQGTDLADRFGRLQTDLSLAAAIVLWICAGLFAGGGMLEPPLGINLKRLSKADSRLVWVAIGLIAVCFFTGHLVFNGMRETSDRHITVLGDFGSYICQILPCMTIVFLGASKWRRRVPALLLLVFLEFGVLIILGRRVLVYGIVVACLSASLVGFRMRLSWIKKGLFAAAAVGTVYIGMEFFYAMRMTFWQLNDDASMKQLASGAIDMMADKTGNSLQEALARNVRERTSIIVYLSDLLAASKLYPPLYGKDFVYSVKWTIPSVFYPDKDTSPEEVLTNPQFGLRINDDPNSVLTSGIADFGVLGCCAYPFLVVIGLRLLLGVLRSRLSEAAFVMAFATVITVMFQAETGLPSETAMAREIVLMAILVEIAKRWPAIRGKKAESERLLSLRLGGPPRTAPVEL